MGQQKIPLRAKMGTQRDSALVADGAWIKQRRTTRSRRYQMRWGC